MIRYRIVVDNDGTRTDLLNYRKDIRLEKAVETWQINGGLFVGTLTMTLLPDHPAYNDINLNTSTIYAYENDEETFRGRAVKIDKTLTGRKNITCESDIKFLLDVPDIFSDKEKGNRQQYYIGTEDGYQYETMTTVPPKRWRFNYAFASQYHDRYDPCQLTRFGENQTYNGKTVTRNEVRTDAAMFAPEGTYGAKQIDFDLDWGRRVGLYGGQAGNSRYTNYWLGLGAMNHPGGIFTVEWKSDNGEIHSYKLPLQRFAYKYTYYDMASSPWSRVYIPGAVQERSATGYFIGNFGIVENSDWVTASDYAGDVRVIRDSTEIPLSDVPFCIVHYNAVMHWFCYGPKTDGTPALYWTQQSSEDIIYAIPESAGVTQRTSTWLRMQSDGGSNASQIAMAILQKPGGTYRYDETTPTEDDAIAGNVYLKAMQYLPEADGLEESQYFSSLYDPRVTYYSDRRGPAVADPQPQSAQDILDAYNDWKANAREHPYYVECMNAGGNGRQYAAVPYDVSLYHSREIKYYRREFRELAGYNAYVPKDRRIYRGSLEINGEVDNSSVDSCYAALQKVIDASGGYAQVVLRDGYYVIDITQDSGVESNDFYVDLGKNLQDAKHSLTCDGIVTGIYPVGVGKDGEQDLPPYTLQDLDAADADSIFAMTDKSRKYRYTGYGESWFPHSLSTPWYYHHVGEALTEYQPFDDEWSRIRYAATEADATVREYLYMVGGTLYRYSADNNQWEEYTPQEGDHYGEPVCAKNLSVIMSSGDTTKTYATGGAVMRYTGGQWMGYILDLRGNKHNVYPAASTADIEDDGKWYYLLGDASHYWTNDGSSIEPHEIISDGSVSADEVSSPEDFVNRGADYKISSGSAVCTLRNGRYYYYDSNRHQWAEYEEAKGIHDSDGYTHDPTLGVVWHDEARNEYGSIVDYVEYDVSHVPEGIRLQYLITQSEVELRNRLTAFESLDISAVDPRLIGLDGARPVLGNYYRVTIPWLGISDYKRLTRVVTDMVKPSGSKLTFGQKQNTLSDYVGKKGERL